MSTAFTFQDTIPLLTSSGTPAQTIPRIGYGSYKSASTETILTALRLGYRHIDTAFLYGNEATVGEAVRKSGIPRSEIFITTKIWDPAGSPEATYQSIKESVERINGGPGGYVDLFLIHRPNSGPAGRKEMWQALERAKKEGLTKSIGVSNYGLKHIQETESYATEPITVNQIELHPWLQQHSIVDYCQSKGIVVEAYAPLVRNRRAGDPTLVEISKNHGVSEAQVLLRWSLQRGFVPLPKSDHEERIKSNADLYHFELTKEEMDKLDALDLGEDGEGAICPYPVHCD